MSLDRILNSSFKTRVFVLASSTSFLFLICIRIFLFPSKAGEASQLYLTVLDILDSFTTGYIVTILLALAVHYFTPSREESSKIEHCHSRDIGKNFNKALSNANRWMFKGNLGRYLRSKVLPAISNQRGRFIVDAIFINPSDDFLCEQFANYKNNNSLNDSSTYLWKKEDVKAQIIATLAICCWYTKYQTLSINLYLANFFSPMRVDSNSHTTFIAVENSKEPCLILNDDHFLNNWFLNDFSIATHQSSKLDLQKIEKPSLSDIDLNDLLSVCESLGIENQLNETLKTSLKLIHENKNPYG